MGAWLGCGGGSEQKFPLCVVQHSLPGQVTSHSIKGDVEDIERVDGRTEVIVDEGISQAVYPLDESLINFGSALEDGDYVRAVDILDGLQVTSEVDAMWRQLSTIAVTQGDLRIAQRCAAALGDVAMSRFQAMPRRGVQRREGSGLRLGPLHGALKDGPAEQGLARGRDRTLESREGGRVHRDVPETIQARRGDSGIETSRHPEAANMRRAHFQYLIDTSQDDAAELKESEGDYLEAINLYLKGACPARRHRWCRHTTSTSLCSSLRLSPLPSLGRAFTTVPAISTSN